MSMGRQPSDWGVNHLAHDSIRIAYSALERFPDLVKRHKFLAGGAAISSSLVALAGVAIARRMRAGQSAEEALASVTSDELEGLRLVDERELEANAASDEPPEPATDSDAPTDQAAASG